MKYYLKLPQAISQWLISGWEVQPTTGQIQSWASKNGTKLHFIAVPHFFMLPDLLERFFHFKGELLQPPGRGPGPRLDGLHVELLQTLAVERGAVELTDPFKGTILKCWSNQEIHFLPPAFCPDRLASVDQRPLYLRPRLDTVEEGGAVVGFKVCEVNRYVLRGQLILL